MRDYLFCRGCFSHGQVGIYRTDTVQSPLLYNIPFKTQSKTKSPGQTKIPEFVLNRVQVQNAWIRFKDERRKFEWNLPGLHTGFNVHSKVRTESKKETERVGKYMIRPILSLKRLSLDEALGQVVYQHRKHSSERDSMDYLEFIARVTSHIPDKGQVMVRYYGLCKALHKP